MHTPLADLVANNCDGSLRRELWVVLSENGLLPPAWWSSGQKQHCKAKARHPDLLPGAWLSFLKNFLVLFFRTLGKEHDVAQYWLNNDCRSDFRIVGELSMMGHILTSWDPFIDTGVCVCVYMKLDIHVYHSCLCVFCLYYIFVYAYLIYMYTCV